MKQKGFFDIRYINELCLDSLEIYLRYTATFQSADLDQCIGHKSYCIACHCGVSLYGGIHQRGLGAAPLQQ